MSVRILLVEDDADNQDTLAMLLTLWGYEVLVADSGESAVDFAATHRPDLVVLDLGLPGLQGEDTATILKRMGAAPFIIAYSGYDRRAPAAPKRWAYLLVLHAAAAAIALAAAAGGALVWGPEWLPL